MVGKRASAPHDEGAEEADLFGEAPATEIAPMNLSDEELLASEELLMDGPTASRPSEFLRDQTITSNRAELMATLAAQESVASALERGIDVLMDPEDIVPRTMGTAIEVPRTPRPRPAAAPHARRALLVGAGLAAAAGAAFAFRRLLAPASAPTVSLHEGPGAQPAAVPPPPPSAQPATPAPPAQPAQAVPTAVAAPAGDEPLSPQTAPARPAAVKRKRTSSRGSARRRKDRARR